MGAPESIAEEAADTSFGEALVERIAAPIGMEGFRAVDIAELDEGALTERFMGNGSRFPAHLFMIPARDLACYAKPAIGVLDRAPNGACRLVRRIAILPAVHRRLGPRKSAARAVHRARRPIRRAALQSADRPWRRARPARTMMRGVPAPQWDPSSHPNGGARHMVNGADPVAAGRRMWMDAVNRGALEEYVDRVSEDVVWLPPAGEPIVGRDAFRAWLEPFFQRFDYRFSVEPTWVRGWDGWCAEHGRFRSELSPRSGDEAQEHDGHYFVLWRREDESVWRIERYVHGIGAGGQPI